MALLKHFIHLINFMALPKESRRLVFYSEGKNYWPHLSPLLQDALDELNIPICYITSSFDDPGLDIKHKNLKTFVIGDGALRNWLFANIDTEIMVMTMPDLHQYQVKKSCHPVHYVYVQHSLVSLHTVYRNGAFNHYDTIFCAGPHHVSEMQAITNVENLKPKNLVAHGYDLLHTITERWQTEKQQSSDKNEPKHVLLAPSWGEQAIIESGYGEDIIDVLLKAGYHVTLRPHPQTFKHFPQVNDLIERFQQHKAFTYEENVAMQTSLFDADIMISDWSGVALEYALGLRKPVIFIDVPPKINNPEYQKVKIEPIEVSIREHIGKVIQPESINDLPAQVKAALSIQISDQIVDSICFKSDSKPSPGMQFFRNHLNCDA